MQQHRWMLSCTRPITAFQRRCPIGEEGWHLQPWSLYFWSVFLTEISEFVESNVKSRYWGMWKSAMFSDIFQVDRLVQTNLADEQARERLLQDLLKDSLEGPTTRLMNFNPANLACRELPPGNWSQLYILYQAHCLALKQPAASRTVFYSCASKWKKCLRFRHRSQHSICQTCDRLKAEMRHADSFMTHASAADRLLAHLTMTWKCREQYWNARSASRSKQELLCIIVDGYDRSKPCLPRWTQGRPPKGGAFDAWQAIQTYRRFFSDFDWVLNSEKWCRFEIDLQIEIDDSHCFFHTRIPGQVQSHWDAALSSSCPWLGMWSVSHIWEYKLRLILHMGNGAALHQFLLACCSRTGPRSTAVVSWHAMKTYWTSDLSSDSKLHLSASLFRLEKF